MQYSVLMTVYNKENAKYFDQSIDSMLRQTIITNDFVIVCDGNLTNELDDVINKYINLYPSVFNIIKLNKNKGNAIASQIGINQCKNEIVLKMDSDDISRVDRAEKLLQLFENDKELVIAGGYISEFEGNADNVVAIKKVPLKYNEILKYAKRRNPFNNQSIAFKKSKVIECGGYKDYRRCEDYELFIRMFMLGCKGVNIPEILVDYRLNKNAYIRRNNWANTKGFIQVRYHIYKNGFSNLLDFIIPSIVQIALFMLPLKITKAFYILMRKSD